jgi:hypothetical protein
MRRIAVLAALLVEACGVHGEPGTQPLMRFDLAPFYSAPFPSEHRRDASGKIDIERFPDPMQIDIAEKLRALIERDSDGFGATSAVFFPMSGPLSEADIPKTAASDDPHLFLIGVDPKAPDLGVRYPITAHFYDDAGPFGTKNLLVLLPLQGVPLRPHALYAAGVMRDLLDVHEKRLGVSDSMAKLAHGDDPDGLGGRAAADYHTAIGAIEKTGVRADQLAGLAVFRTQDPVSRLADVTRAALSMPLPKPSAPFRAQEIFDGYCVYHTTIGMPDFQSGQPPFSMDGGGWTYDASGAPMLQRTELANLVITIPRAPAPAAGYPLIVFIRTGGGGDRPLVDRGVQGTSGGPPLVPGTGPALTFARAGFAGASVDGPLGGLRNTTGADEQFLIFNVQNPVALRDNLRESALELALFAHVLADLSIDVSSCPGTMTSSGTLSRFDAAHFGLMGHSMGATIAPVVLAIEPMYRVGLFSGAGGSWIENVIYKQKPLAVKGFAEILLGYPSVSFELTEFDPLLSMLQWAGESADPPSYARAIIDEPSMRSPTHVLMMQGIVDHYILPPIANATSLSVGLDLAGMPLETSLMPLLSFVGRRAVDLPIADNRTVGSNPVTAVVSQFPADNIEDGHEVVFQTEPPKHAIRCFLQSWLSSDKPMIPAYGPELAACD